MWPLVGSSGTHSSSFRGPGVLRFPGILGVDDVIRLADTHKVGVRLVDCRAGFDYTGSHAGENIVQLSFEHCSIPQTIYHFHLRLDSFTPCCFVCFGGSGRCACLYTRPCRFSNVTYGGYHVPS